MREGISVKGLDRAIALCRLAPPAVEKELRVALREAASPVLADARSESPRRTGALAGSGRVSVRMRGRTTAVAVAFGGSKAPYAAVRMFGRRAVVRSYDRGGSAVSGYVRALRPVPFLPRVGERHAPEVAERVVRGVQAVIERLARG